VLHSVAIVSSRRLAVFFAVVGIDIALVDAALVPVQPIELVAFKSASVVL